MWPVRVLMFEDGMIIHDWSCGAYWWYTVGKIKGALKNSVGYTLRSEEFFQFFQQQEKWNYLGFNKSLRDVPMETTGIISIGRQKFQILLGSLKKF